MTPHRTSRRGACGRPSSTPSTARERVDGLPVHLSATDWRLDRAGPVLGQDNERVFSEVLGLSAAEIGRLADEGVI